MGERRKKEKRESREDVSGGLTCEKGGLCTPRGEKRVQKRRGDRGD